MNRNTEKSDRSPLLVLAGPTGTGKSEIALQVAKQIQGAILSADSMQVYRGLDIGSAKVSPAEQAEVPHYLLDWLEPEEACDAARFQTAAKEAIRTCQNLHQIPILTGGTGFYIQAVVRDIQFTAAASSDISQKKWGLFAEKYGNAALHQALAQIDPDSAASIPEQNKKRVIRALVYYDCTGQPISEHNAQEKLRESPYDVLFFLIWEERETLYPKLDRRVDQMVAKGLEEEARRLFDRGLTEAHPAMQGIGYKEFFPYFRGESSRADCIDAIKRHTRQYAKRQMTWFRSETDAICLHREDFSDDSRQIASHIIHIYKERGCNHL